MGVDLTFKKNKHVVVLSGVHHKEWRHHQNTPLKLM